MLGRIARIFCVFSLVAASASAQDDDVNVFAREGFYLGASAVFGNPRFRDSVTASLEDFIELHPSAKATSSNDWGVGFNARAGYRFHPHFAFEFQYEWIDTRGFPVFAAVSADSDRENTLETEIQIRRPEWVVTGNSKLFITKGRVQPFLVGGAGAMHATMTETGPLYAQNLGSGTAIPGVTINCPCLLQVPALSGNRSFTEFALRFGGGLDIYITENLLWNGTVDFVYPFGQLQDQLDYVSFSTGLTWRFGSTE